MSANESGSVLAGVKSKVNFRIRVRLRIRDKILAGIPRDASMLDYFVDSKFESAEEKKEFMDRVQTGLTEEEKKAVKDRSWCAFEKDKSGDLCIWHGNIKAMLREIFVTIGLTQRSYKKRGKESGEGHAGGKQTLQHTVNVEPHRPKFFIDGKPTKVPSGFVDRIKHISDMNGQRSAIGRHDYLEGAELEFDLIWPRDGCFTLDDIKKALSFCEDDGLGASRSQGYGKFEVVELTEIWK